MANTYTSLHYHFTFSTKNREPWIASEIEGRVWSYIGGVAGTHKMSALRVGGVEDHVHALVLAPPTLAPSQIAQFLKGDSSKWIHEEFSKMRGFDWQDGYGAFTVSRSQIPEVIDYIKSQREHHPRRPFKKNILSCCKNMESITTTVICGDDSGVATRHVIGLESLCRP